MLEAIINYLNQKLVQSGLFERVFCLAELHTDATGQTAPRMYIAEGELEHVTEPDKYKGMCYWRKVGDTSVGVQRRANSVPCREDIEFSHRLKLVCLIPRDALDKDDAYSDERVAESLIADLTESKQLKTQLNATRVSISVSSYQTDNTTLLSAEYSNLKKRDFRYRFVYLALEVSAVVEINKSCLTQTCP